MSVQKPSADPPQRQAAKDCRTCNRRRIRCDRTLPRCRKCASRDLECPGYGLNIRFEQGIASRGRLSGKATPLLKKDNPHGLNRTKRLPTPQTTDPSASSKRLSPCPNEGSRESMPPSSQFYGPEMTLNNEFATLGQFDLQVLPPGIDHSSAKGLLVYYDHIVAPLMTWFDGPDNEWRNIMLPMAFRSSQLLLAMLAMTAEHYACKTGKEWPFPDGNTSSTLRQQSLRLLSENLQIEMSSNLSNDGRVAEVLATVVVLCNLEMMQSESELWHLHWNAVRTITQRWTTTSILCHPTNAECRSLLVEAFTYDALASCSTFDGGDPIPFKAVHPDDLDVLLEFLQVVQDITQLERKRHSRVPAISIPPLNDMDELLAQFERCRAKNLEFVELMRFPSSELRLDFMSLIDLYHNTGIIYGMQALMDPNRYSLDRRDYMYRAFDCFRRIKHIGHFQQDVIWPLFIIGAEARQHPDLQAFVHDRIIDLMNATGWHNGTRALQFLKQFWAGATAGSWVDYARFKAAEGFRFLLV